MKSEKLPIFHLVYPNRYLLCSSLMRFAAYYEDPKFRGKWPSLEEYMDSYAKMKGWEFTYFDDWEGFNFPGYVLEAPVDLSTDYLDLLNKEEKVRVALEPYRAKHGDNLYVIGTFRGDGGWALGHEMVHAYFYLHPDYAKDVEAVCKEFPKPIERLSKCLIEMGYHKKVLLDECNAYITTGLPTKMCGRSKFQSSTSFRKLRRKLQAVFKSHFGHPVSKLNNSRFVKSRITTIHMKVPEVR
jgi:hypothetical protein